ncbi:MAG: universal stress protein, partial [Bacteroidia bacterium]|nr:universal stress protein [Bacteroidia bacterium]
MKKVVIPTDFSDNAFNAISFALEFFKYDITEFYFMHAYEDEVYEDEELLNEKTLDEVIELLHNQTLLKLESLIKRLNKIAPNPRYSFFTISAFNSLIDEVDKIVLEKNIDLVVMGTKGATADRNVSFGSNTLHVLKYVQCPVLAIPSNYEYTQPKKILFPSNFLIPYKRRELKLLCTLAKPYRSKIELLYISDTMNLSRRQKANKEFIEDELKSNKVTFNVVSGKSKTKVIQNSIKTNNIDMLTMVNTRHSFLEDLL